MRKRESLKPRLHHPQWQSRVLDPGLSLNDNAVRAPVVPMFRTTPPMYG